MPTDGRWDLTRRLKGQCYRAQHVGRTHHRDSKRQSHATSHGNPCVLRKRNLHYRDQEHLGSTARYK